MLLISELAERSGMPVSTLRYYERIGLVQPSGRAGNNYREYDEATLERLAFIARAKRLGMNLDDVATLTEAWFAGECEPLRARLRKSVTGRWRRAGDAPLLCRHVPPPEEPTLSTRLADDTAPRPPDGGSPGETATRAHRAGGARWQTAGWLAVGTALPAGSSAALVSQRGTVPNTDIALLLTGAVLIVATSGRRGAAALAALSAAVSFDYFHTLPYHSLTIANRNDALATLVLGLLALAVGQIAATASDSHVELVLIAGAAVLSQAVPEPARFLVDHRGLDISLGVLVFATALAIPPRTFRGLTANAGRLVAAVASTVLALPALSWAVSHFVPSLALRRGVLTVGLAPAEIASVATTSLAGGDTAVAAAMLVSSSLLTVAAAGVGLRLLGGGGNIHLLPLLTNLGLVVGAPMAAGIAIRTAVTLSPRQEAAAERVSVAVVTLLVWLVASQVHLSRSYVAVAGALALFLAGSAILGATLGFRAPAPVAKALLLTTSMRDFAIAAAIAVAAFGAGSAAPLGIYGVMVITWGMAVATLRPTQTQPSLTSDSHVLSPNKALPYNSAASASTTIPARHSQTPEPPAASMNPQAATELPSGS